MAEVILHMTLAISSTSDTCSVLVGEQSMLSSGVLVKVEYGGIAHLQIVPPLSSQLNR